MNCAMGYGFCLDYMWEYLRLSKPLPQIVSYCNCSQAREASLSGTLPTYDLLDPKNLPYYTIV